MYAYVIKELQKITLQKLEEIHCIELFENIEMPLVEVLAQMQYDGIYIDKKALIKSIDSWKENNSAFGSPVSFGYRNQPRNQQDDYLL